MTKHGRWVKWRKSKGWPTRLWAVAEFSGRKFWAYAGFGESRAEATRDAKGELLRRGGPYPGPGEEDPEDWKVWKIEKNDDGFSLIHRRRFVVARLCEHLSRLVAEEVHTEPGGGYARGAKARYISGDLVCAACEREAERQKGGSR